MMKNLPRILGLLAVMTAVTGLAACSSSKSSPGEVTTDPCGASQHQSLVGTSAKDLDMSQFPKGTRLLYPTTPMTRDYRIDRLNIHADKNGKIIRVDCS